MFFHQDVGKPFMKKLIQDIANTHHLFYLATILYNQLTQRKKKKENNGLPHSDTADRLIYNNNNNNLYQYIKGIQHSFGLDFSLSIFPLHLNNFIILFKL